jgi:hypothetical protein
VRTHFEYNMRLQSQRVADLQNKTAELERELSDARGSLERELSQFPETRETVTHAIHEACHCDSADMSPEYGDDDEDEDEGLSSFYRASDYRASDRSAEYGGRPPGDQPPPAEDRTEVLVSRGRRNAYYPGLSRRIKIAIGTVAGAVIITIVVIMMSSGGSSWPASVATVQTEASRACQNPDVKSEPGQINFACATATRQILWVFALLTSADNPNFADAKSGRRGLEPIKPAQGGEVAWFLNLHHPYSPSNPVDSLQVAARAINNIIGGATLTGANGGAVVQSGLESSSANCRRYTGSAAVASRNGFPSICAKPVTTSEGQAALVADVYAKWVADATPEAAHDAAVLFEDAKDPGNPQVQAILRNLPHSRLAA